ncbi:MAG: ferritin [bacterium]|nr:ferritin [bacterium]
MKTKIETALNEQVHAEFFSFYLYLSMAAYFKTQHLDGFAHWMRTQAQEEYSHAMKLFDYLIDRGGDVNLLGIDSPPANWSSPSAAFEAVVKHEIHITNRIDELVSLANAENDHATSVVLHWFVNEQVEEVSIADTLFHQVKMVEDNPHGLLMLDRELAQRPDVSLTAPAGGE